MRKSQFAIFFGILLSVFLVLSCSNSSGGGDPETPENKPSNPESTLPKYYTVTFVAGENAYYTSFGNRVETYERRVEEGKTVNELLPEISILAEDNFYYVYEYDHYCISGTDTVFDFSTPITKDITLVAQYEVAKPSALLVTSGSDGKTLKISFDHPKISSYKEVDDLEYVLTVSKAGVVIHTENAKAEKTITIEYKDLEHGITYDVEAWYQYKSKTSKTLKESGTPTVTSRVLMLMYLDGDNNLNDPIFTDLNEVEYGISKLSESAASEVTVMALWDGLATVGDGKTTPTKGFPGTQFLKLGADDELNDTLSANTINLSENYEWLSKGEVDMSDKQTLINFLNSALSLYNSKNIVLQFSNHGGGPRSYSPRKVTLKNGKTITLSNNTGRRSMCWDESSGGETFLKTTDLSAALEEVGFNSDNKVQLIIEDVCLGASIEEIYELSDYTDYILASPNNIPEDGLDYANFIENIEKWSFYDTKTYLSWAGRETCIKYRSDYELTAEQANTLYELILAQNEIDASTLTDEDVSDIKMRISLDNSMNTISIYNTSYYFKDIVKDLNSIVTEILANGDKACTKIFYDTVRNGITTTANENTRTISRSEAIKEITLRYYDSMLYRGTFSWLYDLGYVCDNIYAVASMENWTALKSPIESIARSLYLSCEYCWRDGVGVPTYCSRGNSRLTKNKYGWLANDSQQVHYGVTISGETVRGTIDGDTIIFEDGKYPSWYTELKFGQDCKWNDLLKAWFPQN